MLTFRFIYISIVFGLKINKSQRRGYILHKFMHVIDEYIYKSISRYINNYVGGSEMRV